MKTKITVTELSHDDLVNLLSTALYGSNWFAASYDKKIYESLTETEGDCFEDKLADMLLAGHKITITDYYAEGESYSKKCVGFDGEDAEYEVTLKDFLKTASTKSGFKLVEEVLDGNGDYWTGDEFLQMVMFGDVIYG
jgi:hypothetical protein